MTRPERRPLCTSRPHPAELFIADGCAFMSHELFMKIVNDARSPVAPAAGTIPPDATESIDDRLDQTPHISVEDLD